MKPNQPTLEDAIRSLADTKAEHRELVGKIAGDPGMSPEVREALLTHLYEEEDEHMEEISSLLGQAAPAAGASPPPSSSRLTVGSLRPGDVPGPGPQTLGSLRPDY